jgi:hypothetical protein
VPGRTRAHGMVMMEVTNARITGGAIGVRYADGTYDIVRPEELGNLVGRSQWMQAQREAGAQP